jgi:hypothetical protein
MWGAVGYIGMRWKAFATADELGSGDAQAMLCTIADVQYILKRVCTGATHVENVAGSKIPMYRPTYACEPGYSGTCSRHSTREHRAYRTVSAQLVCPQDFEFSAGVSNDHSLS